MGENILEYKGYYTKILYSVKDHVLYGKIEGIRDLVNFESESIENIEQEFHSAVDDYLALDVYKRQLADRRRSMSRKELDLDDVRRLLVHVHVPRRRREDVYKRQA